MSGSQFPAFPSLAPPRTELPTQADEGARVLAVDDSPTILRVVGAILERHGYEVVGARDGIEALERLRASPPFDLVLLDFAMPRMNGYQFCRELRRNPDWAELAVVLMSARAHEIGERFVEQTGAADALMKPFDARALIAVVGGVLSKRLRGETGRRPAPAPDEMIEEAELTADSVGPPPSRYIGALDGDVPEDAEVLRGSIEHLPLAEVLQLFQLRRQSGVLRVSRARKAVAIALSEGHVDQARGRALGDEFRIGRYLERLGKLTRDQVEEQVDACAGKMVLGKWLVEHGLVAPEELERALALQTADLCYEVIRWQKGRFVLSAEPAWPQAKDCKLGLGLAELVLEGFRRVDEWRLMQDAIDFDAVPAIDRAALDAVAGKLGAVEQRVLDAVDGERTVREVMANTGLASFDAASILYRLFETRIVRKK